MGSDIRDPIRELVSQHLTLEQAQQVREWRCVDPEATWRKVAELAHETWNANWVVPGHQLYGIALCEVASAMLGEDPYQDPWN